jgi:hypothetical protein
MTSLKVGKTKNGKGLIADRAFRPGSIVYRIKGELISYREVNRRGGSSQSNTFRFDSGRYLSPVGELGDFQNHSCEPNAKIVKRAGQLYVLAIQDISKGAEVMIDYSTVLARNDTWEMRCKCGAKSCRKVVRRYTALPPAIKKGYIRRDIIPPYILNIRTDRS